LHLVTHHTRRPTTHFHFSLPPLPPPPRSPLFPYTTLFRSPSTARPAVGARRERRRAATEHNGTGWLGAGGGSRPGALSSGIHNPDRKSTRLNSSHVSISYAVFCLKKKKK